jgi:hypothetical protein
VPRWGLRSKVVLSGCALSLLSLSSRELAARPCTGETPADAPPCNSAEAGLVEQHATQPGLAFQPSTPGLYDFRFALGGYYDAIDPQVMYGLEFRIPQLSLDARYGLGSGWSLTGHFNSMFVTNELLIGGAFAQRFGAWSYEVRASAGVYLGKLGQFGFDALVIAPQYRPELAVGYALGEVALSLRGSLLLMSSERVRIGDVWGGLDNASVFVGHSEMLFVENPMHNGSAWYFGLGLMTTRAYYAFWVLFPDSPALFTYPRMVAGYEF